MTVGLCMHVKSKGVHFVCGVSNLRQVYKIAYTIVRGPFFVVTIFTRQLLFNVEWNHFSITRKLQPYTDAMSETT